MKLRTRTRRVSAEEKKKTTHPNLCACCDSWISKGRASTTHQQLRLLPSSSSPFADLNAIICMPLVRICSHPLSSAPPAPVLLELHQTPHPLTPIVSARLIISFLKAALSTSPMRKVELRTINAILLRLAETLCAVSNPVVLLPLPRPSFRPREGIVSSGRMWQGVNT